LPRTGWRQSFIVFARRLSGDGLAVRAATLGRRNAVNQRAGEVMAGIVSANATDSAITLR